jgi:hypothetical protein
MNLKKSKNIDKETYMDANQEDCVFDGLFFTSIRHNMNLLRI